MMATTVTPVLDLNSQASFPIRLGSSILQPSKSRKYAAVRYNHKPHFPTETIVDASITHLPNVLGLILETGDTKYKYVGRDVGAKENGRYVLLPTGSGKSREMVLEKLSTCTDFDLVEIKRGKDAQRVINSYPRLPKGGSADDQFADGVDSLFGEPADPSNPFDYRNYLSSTVAKPSPSKAEFARETARTPQVQPQKNPTTPLSKPSKQSDHPLILQKKRKATDATKPNPKRVKAGEEPPPRVSAAESKINAPRVVLDRKASLKLPPFEDSGELVVDYETPVLEKPRSAMHLALTGQLGAGPISLHSAANSPAGRRLSPDPPRSEHADEDADVSLGGSSPEALQGIGRRGKADYEDDADVEDLELPSPARIPHSSTQDDEPIDDEDDLEKQVALAMAEEDDVVERATALQPESEEESEEE